VLECYGVTLRYAGSYLRVTWPGGSEMTIRQAEREIHAHVGHATSAGDAVVLELRARMTVPEPGHGWTVIELSFPRALAADVHRLADRINADRINADRVNAEGGSAEPTIPEWVNASRSEAGRPGGEGPASEPRGATEPDSAPREPSAQEARPASPAAPKAAGPDPAPAEYHGPSRLRLQHSAGPPPAAAQPPSLPLVKFRADLSAWADDDDWIGIYPPGETIRLIEVPPPGQAHERDPLPSA
jgi:hypothetical protein